MVLRGPGLPGRRGAAGAPLRRGGRHGAPHHRTQVSGGGGPVCGPGAILRPHRRQGGSGGGEGPHPRLQGRLRPGLPQPEGRTAGRAGRGGGGAEDLRPGAGGPPDGGHHHPGAAPPGRRGGKDYPPLPGQHHPQGVHLAVRQRGRPVPQGLRAGGQLGTGGGDARPAPPGSGGQRLEYHHLLCAGAAGPDRAPADPRPGAGLRHLPVRHGVRAEAFPPGAAGCHGRAGGQGPPAVPDPDGGPAAGGGRGGSEGRQGQP